MNPETPGTVVPHAPRPFARRLVPVTLLALAAALAQLVPVDANRVPPPAPAAPLVSILTPHNDLALNESTLRVRALVAAVKSARGEHFQFDGSTAAGRNVGKIRSVALALDGVELATMDASRDGPQIVATFQVDLAGLAAGAHFLDVTAVANHSGWQTTERVMFTLDPTLPIAERNRIEEAATPEPFQGFVVRAKGWNDTSDAFEESDDDDDDTDDDPARPASGRFTFSGRR